MKLIVEGETRASYYRYYLTTGTWRERRRAALDAAGYRCQKCREPRRLNVHHLTYERLGQERPEDLQVLCRGCHETTHGRVPRPIDGPEHIRFILARVLDRFLADEAG